MLAPEFSLPADDGTTVSLADLRGRTVVLFFYPKDNTPTCTTEACDLRDSWAALKRAGLVVLGISPDSVKSHAKFKRKYDLPFRLLADEGHQVAENYGAWGDKVLFGVRYRGILRKTFVIGPDGVILHVFDKVKAKGHAAEILKAVKLAGTR